MIDRVGEFVIGHAVLTILGVALVLPVEWTHGTWPQRPVLLVHSGGVGLTAKQRRTLRMPRRPPCEAAEPQPAAKHQGAQNTAHRRLFRS